MTTNPLQMRLAAMWDTAMGDGNGMAAAAALSQAVAAARVLAALSPKGTT